MIRKKRGYWPKSISLEVLNGTKTNDTDISWSSSSSDADNKVNSNHSCNKKRLKTTKINKPEIGEITPTKYTLDQDFDLSPIIGKTVPEERSPTLNSRDDDERDKSPIIGKNSILRNWKEQINSPAFRDKFRPIIRKQVERYHGNTLNISTYSSSDSSETEDPLSISQFTTSLSNTRDSCDDEIQRISQYSSDTASQFHKGDLHIEAVESPNNSPDAQQIITSQHSSTRDSPVTFISQNVEENNADLLANSTVNVAAPSLSTLPVFLYQPPPRKKRYKKNGLAQRLQKCLKRRNGSVGIWKHELYLKWNISCEDLLCLQVSKMHQEFQNTVFECNVLININSNNSSSTCVAVLSDSVEKVDTCPKMLKLYKPYNESFINWYGQGIYCYYNICKILFDF